MRSQCKGESWVARPLSHAKFYEEIDPAFEVDWFSGVFGVSVPTLNRTHGTCSFHGSYNPGLKKINYTMPYAGLILHELAHHICHEQGHNGRRDMHGSKFGEVLQELLDLWV